MIWGRFATLILLLALAGCGLVQADVAPLNEALVKL